LSNNAYRRIKATNKKLRSNNIRLKAALVLSTILAVASMIGLFVFASLYFEERINNVELSAKIENQNDTINMIRYVAENEKDTIVRLSKVAAELDKENTKLVQTLESQDEELSTYREREELYNLYEYALVRDDESRTDISYEDIKTLEELSIEKGLGKDAVGTVLAISVNESSGYANVKNKKSSAAGLCGLTKGTAKYIYENELGNGDGSYDHSYAYDATTNLQISLAYIAYLKNEYGENNDKILQAYRGEPDAAYVNKLCKLLGVKSLSELDI
jgi:soluble lytic murein transglycosylase-like protein